MRNLIGFITCFSFSALILMPSPVRADYPTGIRNCIEATRAASIIKYEQDIVHHRTIAKHMVNEQVSFLEGLKKELTPQAKKYIDRLSQIPLKEREARLGEGFFSDDPFLQSIKRIGPDWDNRPCFSPPMETGSKLKSSWSYTPYNKYSYHTVIRSTADVNQTNYPIPGFDFHATGHTENKNPSIYTVELNKNHLVDCVNHYGKDSNRHFSLANTDSENLNTTFTVCSKASVGPKYPDIWHNSANITDIEVCSKIVFPIGKVIGTSLDESGVVTTPKHLAFDRDTYIEYQVNEKCIKPFYGTEHQKETQRNNTYKRDMEAYDAAREAKHVKKTGKPAAKNNSQPTGSSKTTK